MHLMYTANKGYLDIMLTSIYSIIKNGNLSNIDLHIVTSDFDNDDYLTVYAFIEQFDNITVEFYSLEENPIDEYKLPPWRGTQISNARLFFPKIIKERHPEIKNLLYIDCDTIVKGDLNGLHAYDEFPVSAVREDITLKSYYEGRLGLDKYHNTGVLYMNLDKWNDLDFEYRMKDFFKHYNVVVIYPDQDAFNLLLRDEINSIPTRYNLSLYPFLFSDFEMKLYYDPKRRQLSYDEVLVEKEHATILHSLGLFNIKPWTNNKINPLTPEFSEYVKVINPNFKLEELSPLKKIITISPALFKSIVLVKGYLPRFLEEKSRDLSLKAQKAREK